MLLSGHQTFSILIQGADLKEKRKSPDDCVCFYFILFCFISKARAFPEATPRHLIYLFGKTHANWLQLPISLGNQIFSWAHYYLKQNPGYVSKKEKQGYLVGQKHNA